MSKQVNINYICKTIGGIEYHFHVKIYNRIFDKLIFLKHDENKTRVIDLIKNMDILINLPINKCVEYCNDRNEELLNIIINNLEGKPFSFL